MIDACEHESLQDGGDMASRWEIAVMVTTMWDEGWTSEDPVRCEAEILTAAEHRLLTMSPFHWPYCLLDLIWHGDGDGEACSLEALVSVHAPRHALECWRGREHLWDFFTLLGRWHCAWSVCCCTTDTCICPTRVWQSERQTVAFLPSVRPWARIPLARSGQRATREGGSRDLSWRDDERRDRDEQKRSPTGCSEWERGARGTESGGESEAQGRGSDGRAAAVAVIMKGRVEGV